MRKAIAKTVVSTLLFASISLTAFAAPTTGTVTADALNVRTQPTTQSASLGLLPYGSSVELADQVGSWYKISFMDQVGYIFGDYVKVSEYSETQETKENKANKLIDIAKQYIGTPYVYGGTTPSGFDCSGFVKYVYSQMGITLPRTSYSQCNVGTYINKENLQAGDIVCFGNSDRSINHVGIYIGNNQFIHSPRSGYTLCISDLSGSYSRRLRYARRVL